MILESGRGRADNRYVSEQERSPQAEAERALRKRRRCISCGQIARFITPVGLVCHDHALSETLKQQLGGDGWMPVPLNEPSDA